MPASGLRRPTATWPPRGVCSTGAGPTTPSAFTRSRPWKRPSKRGWRSRTLRFRARTHNLEELQALCLALPQPEIASGIESLDLSDLTPFAVEARYDIEFWPERVESEAAVAIASRVCAAVARIVGAGRSAPE